MKSQLRIIGIFLLVLCTFSAYSQNWDEIIKTAASDRNTLDFYGRSVAIDGDFAIVGAWGEDHDAVGGSTMLQSGSAYILQNISGTWTEVQKLVASDRASSDNFGYAVDINGNWAVVGAWKEDDDEVGGATMADAGSAYIFYNNGSTWIQTKKIVASDRYDGDFFGQSVAINGDYIVVGAVNEDEDVSGANTMNNSGSAYVFYNTAGVWSETQKIVSSDRSAADYFGFDVDISGTYIIVGAYAEDEDETGGGTTMAEAGSAYIFEYSGVVWTELKKIVANDRAPGDYFGYSVAINDTYAVVGAYDEDEDETGTANTLSGAGSAYIFLNAGPLQVPIQKIVASDRNTDDRFGYDVAINGNYIVVGAYFEDDDVQGLNALNQAGSAYIYNLDGTWTEEQKIIANDRDIADYFGSAVAIYDNYIIVGAQLEDEDSDGNSNMPEAGSAYIFQNCREMNVYQSTDIANEGTFDFGDVSYGSSSAELTFTIENTGVDDLILDGAPKIEISGADAADFTINQSVLTSPIAPLGSTTFTIIFTPSSTTLHTAEISISNNDNDENPYNFTITGTGLKLPQTISGFAAILAKTYGDADFLVSATASSGGDVVFTSSDNNIATCSGTNGTTITIVNAGTCDIYANQAGDAIYLAAPQVPQTLVVNAKPITVTGDSGQTKEYGEIDPTYTYTVTTGNLEIGDNFTGDLTRVAGETIGLYQINIGTLDAGLNYNITYVPDDFEITERTIYVTVDAGQSKIYGTSDPGLTYSFTPTLIGGDSFTGSISRIAGENAGFYEIQQSTLNLSSDYILDYTSNDFEVVAKTIIVTPNAGQLKVYGTTDPPAFTYSTSPALESGDSYTGVLSRGAGEDVGLYAITVGTLDAGSNYIMSVADVDFEITAKPITIEAITLQNKMYGDSDPTFTYNQLGTLESGDSFTGALSRDPGEDLGFYAITLGNLSLGLNYNLSFTTANFEVKIKSLAIIVDPDQTKGYGDADPVLTFTTTSAIAPWDTWSGALARDPGESTGTYAISQGTLLLNSNYSIFLMPGETFEITKQSIIVTADAGQSKYYGEANPAAYTYSYTGTLSSGDNFSGSLNRTFGEAVNTYNINQGSLWISSNYLITYISDVFEILPGEIVITADAGQTKEYGSSDPAGYTYTYTGILGGGDNFTGSLTRAAGENAGNYEIQQGSLSLNTNYNITYNADDFVITTKEITVTADAGQSKAYGDLDPAVYTYTVTGTLVGGDNFTGALTRVAGEATGLYEIQQGSLALSSNYNLIYESDNFEITGVNITVTVDAGQTKYYGETDPAEFTYTYSPELLGMDEFIGSLTRVAGENAGAYEIQQGTLELDPVYSITFESDDFTILPIDITVTPDAGQSKVYGEADPADYTYTYTGTLESGDDFTGVLSRELGEDAGYYAIEQGTLDLGVNYNITYNSEDFEITKADPVITWDNPIDIYDGTELTATQLNAVADVAGSFTYNPDFGVVLPVGDNQELTCEFTPDDDINYNIVSASAFINVLLDSKIESYFSDLKVYPNPTRGNLFIDFDETTNANIKILDITGKTIIERTANNSIETIDMSLLPAGVYFVEIEDNGASGLREPQPPQEIIKRVKVIVQ